MFTACYLMMPVTDLWIPVEKKEIRICIFIEPPLTVKVTWILSK